MLSISSLSKKGRHHLVRMCLICRAASRLVKHEKKH